jgi:hypothetical protein
MLCQPRKRNPVRGREIQAVLAGWGNPEKSGQHTRGRARKPAP